MNYCIKILDSYRDGFIRVDQSTLLDNAFWKMGDILARDLYGCVHIKECQHKLTNTVIY